MREFLNGFSQCADSFRIWLHYVSRWGEILNPRSCDSHCRGLFYESIGGVYLVPIWRVYHPWGIYSFSDYLSFLSIPISFQRLSWDEYSEECLIPF